MVRGSPMSVSARAADARRSRCCRPRQIDIVVANAGILPMAMGKPDPMGFVDASDVDLVGVMNTVAVSIPHLPDGSSIIVTGSTAGMIRGTTTSPDMGPGGAGYGWSKRIVIEYVEEMCLHWRREMIRSTPSIRPTAIPTYFRMTGCTACSGRISTPKEKGDARRRRAAVLPLPGDADPVIEPEDMANLGSSWPVRTVATSLGNRSASMWLTSQVAQERPWRLEARAAPTRIARFSFSIGPRADDGVCAGRPCNAFGDGRTHFAGKDELLLVLYE